MWNIGFLKPVDAILTQWKEVVIIIAALPTAYVARVVSQWFIQWANRPEELLKQDEYKRWVLDALIQSLEDANRYCCDNVRFMEGFPPDLQTVEGKLMAAAVDTGKVDVVPSFTADLAILDSHSGEVFGLLGKRQAHELHTSRLLLKDASRRVERICDLLLLRGDPNGLSASEQKAFVETRHLLETAASACAGAKTTLLSQRARIPGPKPRWRWPFVIVLAGLLVFFLIYVALLPGPPKA